MAIKIYKPTSPGRRAASVAFGEITKKNPEKSLLIALRKTGGRNNQGKITAFHRGGGSRRLYRMIDFMENRYNMPAKVLGIEYDPNRTARIALVEYEDKEKRYILAPEGLAVGSTILSSQKKISMNPGNRMSLEYIPSGMEIHNIELRPGQGGKVIRSAGSWATLLATEGSKSQVKMPSGEIRLFDKRCLASLGKLSHADWRNIRIGKAGRNRLKGRKPHVRGKAKNPVDHPHGGGEGNQPVGLTEPRTPWGKPALGVRTRKRKKYSNTFILKRRFE